MKKHPMQLPRIQGGRRAGYEGATVADLLLQLMLLQYRLVLLRLIHAEVIEELATLGDLAEKTTSCREILLMLGEVLAQEIDLLGENGNLHLRRPGVFVVCAMLGDETLLGGGLECHRR